MVIVRRMSALGLVLGCWVGLFGCGEDREASVRQPVSLPDSAPTTSPETGLPVVPVPYDLFELDWLRERWAAQVSEAEGWAVEHDFGFTDQVEESGIQFRHRIVDDAGHLYKLVHYDHGNGVQVADVDGDGSLDLYFTTQVGRNELWRSRGDGTFEDITEQAGVGFGDRVGVSASFADVDNDGDPDLYVTSVRGGNALLENDGSGRFRDITVEAGLEYEGHSSAAVFFDYDRDGLLDILLLNVGVYTTDHRLPAGQGSYFEGLEDAFTGHVYPERTERSVLYRNEGGNRFRDVSRETGLVDGRWSGDAVPFDVDRDGWLDLYVLNMQGDDGLWRNQEGRRFVEEGRRWFPKTPWGGMGAQVIDVNGDGLFDLSVVDMHSDMWDPRVGVDVELEASKPRMEVVPPPRHLGTENALHGNALFLNTGEPPFAEVADERGFETYWPWGLSAEDLNADGWPDVFITSSMNYPFRYHTNKLLLNAGGERFLDAEFVLGVEPRRDGRIATPWFTLDCGANPGHRHCAAAGRETGRHEVWSAVGSRSSVVFDLEGDGDLDIVTNDFNSEPQVLLSDLAQRKPGLSYLKVELEGRRSNRDGLGAVVTLEAAGWRQVQSHDGQSGYLSQSSLPLYFGLGEAESVERVEVVWPSGTVQLIEGPVEKNRTLEIVEP